MHRFYKSVQGGVDGLSVVDSSDSDKPKYTPRQLSYSINDAIDNYVHEHPDFHPHDPNDVKDMSRYIRDRLLDGQ